MRRGTIGRDVGGISKEVLERINGCFPTVDVLSFATQVAHLMYVERKTTKLKLPGIFKYKKSNPTNLIKVISSLEVVHSELYFAKAWGFSIFF